MTRQKTQRDPKGRRGRATRGLSIHVELFEAALARRGHAMPRHEVLAVMAEGCGDRNAHVLEAAARRGDLDPRRLEPLGSVSAPDGTPMTAWRDPAGGVLALGGAPFDRFLASPWGGIACAVETGTPSGGPAAAPVRPRPEADRTSALVAVMSGPHGDEVVLAWDDEELEIKLAHLVRPLLKGVDLADELRDADDREVVRRYYERCEELDNGCSISTTVERLDLPPEMRVPRPAATPAPEADAQTVERNAARAAWARTALSTYAAFGDMGRLPLRDAAVALVRDLARSAEHDGEPGSDRGDGAGELARALKLATLERIEWHGEAGADRFHVTAVDGRVGPLPVTWDGSALDAAVAAFAEVARDRSDYAEDRVAAEQDLLSDLAHLAWSTGDEASEVFAEGLRQLQVRTGRTDAAPRFEWDDALLARIAADAGAAS